MELLPTSTMTKVLPGRKPLPLEGPQVVWPDRPLRLQLAWLPDRTTVNEPDHMRLLVEVDSECTPALFEVGLVPAQVPHWPDSTGPFLTDEPTLLPDPLLPLEPTEHPQAADGVTRTSAHVGARHTGWNGSWIEIPAEQARHASRVRCWLVADPDEVDEWPALDGAQPVEVQLVQLDDEAWTRLGDPALEPHDFTCLQWTHADSIASHHGLEPWSDEHWRHLAEHLASARKMGVTAAFVPVWTPPLDTHQGSYRTNVQLLSVHETAPRRFTFDATLLDRYLALVVELGFAAVELPHLFTQWGAGATPQFWIDGERRFGWDVPATDRAWRTLLEQLLPWLREHLATRWSGLARYWHVSDEPAEWCLDSYTAACGVVRGLLDGETIVDALSEPSLTHLVRVPIVATDHVDGFRTAGLPTPWVYYCTCQSNGVSNRYLALDGVRTRMLGAQLFAQRAQGFLHWGFDFWFAQLATRPIDPWNETSAGGGFVSGDPFVVYPSADGLVESQRHRLVGDAMRDRALFVRAASMLDDDPELGRSRVLALLNPDESIDYNAGWLDNAGYERGMLALAGQLGTD